MDNNKIKQVLASHPTGNRNVRAVLKALSDNGMLAEFNTALSIDPKSVFFKILPKSLQRDFLRRSFDLPEGKIISHPILEIARMILPNLGLSKFIQHESGWASVDAVYHHVDRLTSKRLSQYNTGRIDAVYAYEDGAFDTFSQAKKKGLKCIYDLPIAYWQTGRQLMLEEAQRLPEWAHTLGGGIKDSTLKLNRKTNELELADVVICPGKFVYDSLPDWAKNKKIIIAPFGSPQTIQNEYKVTSSVQNKIEKPLRILFVGSMGQRKGLGDLFSAMKLLNKADFELIVMGSLQADIKFYKNQYPDFTYEVGRPHEEVLALMRSCDVFCLPSIVEGRALVMQEAMSQGLPLIITPNTGGEDLILEGETGFLVPIRSPYLIAERLKWFNNNRSKISIMGSSARQHAEKYTWDSYGAKVISGLKNL